ncbi:MAG: class II aldolase/adducin family protein [Clostridia bacterium]|jgi:L-ribulose-5-phosphate 4-epimerase|nr:class II aldolase/adducin family protein [Clostridia bacterium]
MNKEYQKEVFETSMILYREELVKASSGNVSMRCPGSDWMVITPTGIRYDCMEEEDMVFIHLNDGRREGDQWPSSEYLMHLGIYRKYPEIGGIVHTHSPYVMTIAALGDPLPMITIEGVHAGSNMIPVTERFCIPGTQDITDSILELVEENPRLRAVLIMNHGLVAMGDNLSEALSLAESIEREAQVYFQAKTLGKPKLISEDQRREIQENYIKGRQRE